jgi:hypothetical protein
MLTSTGTVAFYAPASSTARVGFVQARVHVGCGSINDFEQRPRRLSISGPSPSPTTSAFNGNVSDSTKRAALSRRHNIEPRLFA